MSNQPTIGKFNPRSREDTLSRQVWKDTVSRNDQIQETIYQIKKHLCKYPEYYQPIYKTKYNTVLTKLS